MEASKEVITQSEVESEAEYTEGDEEKLQEGHNQEAEVIDSKAQSVADLKKKEQIPTIVVYRHPHHIEMQTLSRQEHVHQHIYTPDSKPIKRCMEDYQHYGKSSSYRNNPRATAT